MIAPGSPLNHSDITVEAVVAVNRVSAATSPKRPSRLLLAAYLVAVWTLPGLLYAVQIYEFGRAVDPGLPFSLVALHAIPVWWVWIVLTPALVLLARAAPIRRGALMRAALLHAMASILVAFVVVTFAAFWFSLTPVFAERQRTFVEWLWALSHATTLHGYVFSYWLVVGAVHIVDYERRLRGHEVAAARREALVARTRMQVLVRQLQPHFLFNSLNALSTLILRRDTEAALAMLGTLADFLRATMRLANTDEQPLRAELELASQYLAVEKARLGERLAVRIEIADEVGDVVVPVLVLQPLVENAVRHGIAAREGGGEIVIRATRVGDVVRLAIENDGPGLPADWRERMEERVGLSNTRARLREAFGDGGRLLLEEVAPQRVRLTIEMPLLRARADEAPDDRAGSTRREMP